MRAGNIQTTEFGLGKLLCVHKTSVSNYWFLMAISVCLFLLLLIMLWALDRNGQSLSENMALFAVIVVLAVLPILVLIYQRKNNAQFYEEGIVYENRRWVKVARWAEIRDVWEGCARVDINGVPTPNQLFFAVRTVDGMTIRFPPRLDDVGQLGDFLKSEAAKWGVPVRNGVPPVRNALIKLGQQK
jgi:hypothetical protein